MERIFPKKDHLTEVFFFCFLALLGAVFISLTSFFKVPCYPVSFTLHTFAIFVLAFRCRPSLAFGAAFTYLLLGTLGLPVFAAHVKPLWMLGKSAGYLVAFPAAAFATSTLVRHGYSKILAALFGQGVIYLLGFLWLASFIGPSFAFTKGVLLFIPSDLVKILLAILCQRSLQ